MQTNVLKFKAAQKAMTYVKNNMRLGIGTGSTTEAFIKLLAIEIEKGLTVKAVPTSKRTADLCLELGISISDLETTPELDLTVDGADEVDKNLNLIKGGGGALLYEKIVARASKELLIIIDESKLVTNLGAFPLPIEVNRFGWRSTLQEIKKISFSLGLEGLISLRMKEQNKAFETDGLHYILDASWKSLKNKKLLSQKLLDIPGVVEHGLFLNMTDKVLMARRTEVVEVLYPN